MKISYLLAALVNISLAVEPNPPTWDAKSVFVLDPSTPQVSQSALDAAFATNGGHEPEDHGQFSDRRYAFLVKPGNHAIDINVGYYMQILGLGKSPKDS